jgi:hypothetical protein
MDKNTEPKKCDKCEGYLCVCKGRSYTPPEPFTGTPRYSNVGKSLFPQGSPHPPKKEPGQ